MALVLGRVFLEKNKSILENSIDEMPNADLGDFAEEFLKNLRKREFGRQIHIICGIFQMLYVLGERSGKETSVDALRNLIFKHNLDLP